MHKSENKIAGYDCLLYRSRGCIIASVMYDGWCVVLYSVVAAGIVVIVVVDVIIVIVVVDVIFVVVVVVVDVIIVIVIVVFVALIALRGVHSVFL